MFIPLWAIVFFVVLLVGFFVFNQLILRDWRKGMKLTSSILEDWKLESESMWTFTKAAIKKHPDLETDLIIIMTPVTEQFDKRKEQ